MTMAKTSLCIIAMAAWLLSSRAAADEFRFDRRSDWQEWTSPIGAIQLRPDGQVELGWYGTDTDPMDDMSPVFASHPQKWRGLRRADGTVEQPRRPGCSPITTARRGGSPTPVPIPTMRGYTSTWAASS